MENRESITPEPLTADDFTDFRLINMEYDEVNREKRYTFECKVRAEPDVLTYILSMHDDGEHFSLHTRNDNIWFRMEMRQLRLLEQIVNRETTFGLLEKDISEAKNEDDLYFVNYAIWELEKDDLTDDQWNHLAIRRFWKRRLTFVPLITALRIRRSIILALVLAIEYAVLLYQYKKTDYCKQTGASLFKIRLDLGKLGEYYIYDDLKKLKGHKKWLFNCYIPKDNGETTEVDVILLHESGMYIFESKNYSGWIFGTETQKYWTQTLRQSGGGSEKYRFYNPIMQNKGHLKWIKNYLGDSNMPVYSYIVFSERCTLKNITMTSNEHFVIKRDSILASVRRTVANAGEQLSASSEQSSGTPTFNSTDNSNVVDKICPKCGGKLVLCTSSRGVHKGNQFWGCSNYPKCRYIENIGQKEDRLQSEQNAVSEIQRPERSN